MWAELTLKPVGHLKYAALSLALREHFFSACIRHILTEYENTVVSSHLIFQTGIEQLPPYGTIRTESFDRRAWPG